MKILVLAVLFTTLVACSGGGNSNSDGLFSPGSNRSVQDKVQGVWERSGYGVVARITGATVELFDVTSETCLLAEISNDNDFSQLVLSDNGREFSIADSTLSFDERYYKLDALPENCAAPIGDSPSAVYDHVWHTFSDYYAFFEERHIDWQAQRDNTRGEVNDAMSESQLFEVLAALIFPIDDEHVLLRAGDTVFSPATPKGFIQALIDEFNAQSDIAEVNEYLQLQLAQWDHIVRERYLDGNVASAANDTFVWGIIDGSVGYLRIDAMILNFEDSIEDQVAEAELILDQILTDLADTQSLIIDIRLNGGGADPLSFAIARRFADSERLVVSKFTRNSEGEGPLQSMYLGPVDRPSYLKPVILITSKFSTSAAEVFTLAMRAWPQVTHIGEATNGALSDVLEKPLPNGWQIELGNEVYIDSAGASYEVSGITPYLEVPIFSLPDRQDGQDSGLNAALEML
ncbi:Uncharacterised protein [Halioglobus japonicus]|nr:Uncharacterised protein [Halioglobus japonicus]